MSVTVPPAVHLAANALGRTKMALGTPAPTLPAAALAPKPPAPRPRRPRRALVHQPRSLSGSGLTSVHLATGGGAARSGTP